MNATVANMMGDGGTVFRAAMARAVSALLPLHLLPLPYPGSGQRAMEACEGNGG